MTKLSKISYKQKLIQILLTDDLQRHFMGIDENNNYYELEDYEYNELKKIFSYSNNILTNYNKREFIYLGLLALTAMAITLQDNLEIVDNYSYNEIIESLDDTDSIDKILESNKNLDNNSKLYINNFINQIGNDFDLTIFKANLKKLKINYLEENQFNKLVVENKLKEKTVAFFDPSECSIYINENYPESIYHELFHTLNVYYDSTILLRYSDTNGKGDALMEGLTAYYTKLYFDEYSYYNERQYVFLLEITLGKDKIKYYYEKGNVEDTINDLKKIYGDEKTANKLIMMMDENLNNKNLMDEEIYKENVNEIVFLLQDYYYRSHEKQMEVILKQLDNYDIKTKRNVVELVLKVFFEKVNVWETSFWDREQRNSYNDKKANSLSNFYNLLVEYNVYDKKEDYLSLVSQVNEEYEVGNYVLFDYDDIIKCVNAIDENNITEEIVKMYVKQ